MALLLQAPEGPSTVLRAKLEPCHALSPSRTKPVWFPASGLTALLTHSWTFTLHPHLFFFWFSAFYIYSLSGVLCHHLFAGLTGTKTLVQVLLPPGRLLGPLPMPTLGLSFPSLGSEGFGADLGLGSASSSSLWVPQRPGQGSVYWMNEWD